MTSDNKIKYEELQYNINREAAKIQALSYGKIGKYEYHTGEEILTFDQSRIIEQATFIYSPLGKAFEKQIKIIEDQGMKQVEALKALKPEENRGLETIEGHFLKKFRNNKLKMNQMKLKNGQKK